MRRLLILLVMLSPCAAMATSKSAIGFTANEGAVTGHHAKSDSNAPVTIEADEMGYEKTHAIVIARGNVKILQNENILSADQVTYYQNSDVVVAEGNVSILQPTGDVMFADKMVLKDDMKRGAVDAFRARLADNSVLVARRGDKINAAVTKLQDASYTPCHVCKDMAPLWSLTTDDATINQASNKLIFHGATMDIFGTPILYTPYLSSPMPGSPAQSGFLSPKYASSSNLGTMVKVPYYWRIGEDRDVTITPWFITDLGPLVDVQYRQLTDHGNYTMQASATNPPKLDVNGNEISGNEFRGNIFAKGEEGLTDYSRVGFDLERATDDTYLRRYGFGSQEALFSRLYAESAEGRNYALAQGLAIQGLRLTDNPKTTPLVVPALQGYYETEPTDAGLKLHVSGDTQSLMRDQGVSQQRLSVTTGATLPYISDGGHVFTTTLNVRQDVYHAEDITLDSGSTVDANTYRALPQAGLEWRYPLMQQFGSDSMTIEPIALLVAQTTGGNPDTISNEDNRLIELTDTNLFSLDRMPGLDLVDSGSRVAYGMRSQYLFSGGPSLNAMLGQNYDLTKDSPFPNSTHPGVDFSDLIGRIALDYSPFTIAYRFALDNTTLSPNRNEFSVGYYNKGYAIDTSYRSLDNNRYLSNSQEGTFNAVIPLTDSWSIYSGAQRDFDMNRMVSARGGAIYRNECFNLMLDGNRNFTSDRDVRASTAYTLTVGFKNLGEFGGQ